MKTDIFNKDIARILTLFSISPGSKHTRNEIKEKTKLNNVPLDKALNNLIKNNILSKEKRLIGVNFESRYSKEVLNILKEEYVRFKEIPLEVYYIIVDLSSNFSEISGISRVFLFGSYSKLIYTKKSDIDIAFFLLNEDKKLINRIKADIQKIEKKDDKTVEPHFYHVNDIKAKDPLIKDILKNGIEI